MKRIFILVSFLMYIYTAVVQAYTVLGASSEPVQQSSSYHTSYIPHGFDTNDQTQIVAEGSFTNSCFRPAGYAVNVDHKTKEIKVTPKAYRYSGYCLMMIVDYSEVIDLGLLKVGQYSILQNTGEQERYFGEISVRAATNSEADDYVYAPIDQAYYEKQNGKNEITLTGNFTNSCMKMADVMVSPKDNVIVVQPISEVDKTASCKDGRFPFKETVDLNVNQKGRFLLHVRSINSKSINKLIDIR